MRALYLPWGWLTAEEQEAALREAGRRGRVGARVDVRRYQRNRLRPTEIARPALYVIQMQVEAPEPWARRWRRQGALELCEDLRVCTHGDGWERQRRTLLGEAAPPGDAAALGLWATEARERWLAARREYQGHWTHGVPLEELPGDHPVRLTVGRAHVRVMRARDEYYLALMLARTAGWDPRVDSDKDRGAERQ